MSAAVRALVAIDEGVDRDAVQATLPLGGDIQIVGVVEGLEDGWTTLQETPTDLLVVACAGYSDRALFLIDGAVEFVPETILAQLRDGGRLAAGIVEDGVTRVAIGRKAGDGFGMAAVADAATAILPGFLKPRGFTF